jgi:hypothetical protein
MTTSSRTAQRGGIFRKVGWLSAAAMLAVAALAPASVQAAGPGNNGQDPTGNGTTSNATVDGSLSVAAGSATLQANAEMFCSGTSVGSIEGTFTLNESLDVGSVITLYLVPNNGSNANPASNVTKNEISITLTDDNNDGGDVVAYSLGVTHPFTVSAGGILVVFAVNADGTTAISSSKTNSLNCTEATPSEQPSDTPSESPSDTPSESPSDTPSESPSDTPSESPSDTPSESPSDTPSESPSDTPSESPSDAPSDVPSDNPSESPSDTPSEQPTEQPTGSELPITSDAPASEAPTGGVEGVTGTPRLTPPPTDTMAPVQAPSTDGSRVILIGLAAILIGALAFSQPRHSSNRR